MTRPPSHPTIPALVLAGVQIRPSNHLVPGARPVRLDNGTYVIAREDYERFKNIIKETS